MYSIVLAASLASAPATPAWFFPFGHSVSGSFTVHGFYAPYGYAPWYLPPGYWYPNYYYPDYYLYPASYYPVSLGGHYYAGEARRTADHALDRVRHELRQLNDALRALEEQMRADQRREAELRQQAQAIRDEVRHTLERLRALEGKGEQVLPPRKKSKVSVNDISAGAGAAGPGTNGRGTGALVVVRLPADARLYLDERLRPGTSPVRSFLTPHLERGAKYYYTFRVEIGREGRQQSQTRRVEFRAGSEVQVSFEQLGQPDRAPSLSAK